MMTDKTLEITYREKYIKVSYRREYKYKMIDLLDRINLNDYFIIKSTGRFKQSKKEDLLNMKHSGYILYKKDYYNLDYIKEWLDVLNNLYVIYLSKSLPPRYVLELIKNNKQI